MTIKTQPFSLHLILLIPYLAGDLWTIATSAIGRDGRQVSQIPTGSFLRSRLVMHNDLRLQDQSRFFTSFPGS